jgi:hypothetical protein
MFICLFNSTPHSSEFNLNANLFASLSRSDKGEMVPSLTEQTETSLSASLCDVYSIYSRPKVRQNRQNAHFSGKAEELVMKNK